MTQIFLNRIQAGRLLGQKIIEKYPSIKDGIVLALPRGGVIIGKVISEKMKLPLDIIVTRKIGAPLNPEYAIAAVAEHEIVLSEHEKIDMKYFEAETAKERQEIARRLTEYRGKKPRINLTGKAVFLVDDGLATGLTMEVAIREVRHKNPRRIILAVPVAPPETLERLKPMVDESVVLQIEPAFFAVGQFYEEFPQVTDEEVRKLLLE